MILDSEQPLRVAVFLDGRPGHEKQSLGILRGLENRLPVEHFRVPVQRPSIFRRILQLLQLFLPLPVTGDLNIQKADLLLGTGSSTHLLMLRYKKQYRIPAVTCMYPEPFLAPFFDLCCVPEHDGVAIKANIVLTVGAPNCSVDAGNHNDLQGLVLLGGIDLESHRWDSEEIMRMVEFIVGETRGMTWTDSS